MMITFHGLSVDHETAKNEYVETFSKPTCARLKNMSSKLSPVCSAALTTTLASIVPLRLDERSAISSIAGLSGDVLPSFEPNRLTLNLRPGLESPSLLDSILTTSEVLDTGSGGVDKTEPSSGRKLCPGTRASIASEKSGTTDPIPLVNAKATPTTLRTTMNAGTKTISATNMAAAAFAKILLSGKSASTARLASLGQSGSGRGCPNDSIVRKSRPGPSIPRGIIDSNSIAEASPSRQKTGECVKWLHEDAPIFLRQTWLSWLSLSIISFHYLPVRLAASFSVKT
ncbi:unnamed protein product [Protopolystoma xenopodis]|uniref:Uncharacterized protein n=1 Tax=Protopolystoma xenopodis TaxID=117903 RepID=A0A3S4ZNZ5_9PLAT|nr:unnamed protein product [Protopolystoma xenopodis]